MSSSQASPRLEQVQSQPQSQYHSQNQSQYASAGESGDEDAYNYYGSAPEDEGLNDDDSDREQVIQLAQNAFDNEIPLKSAYLMKKGGKHRAWKKRWFVLKPTRLCYYKNDKEYELLGMITLDQLEFVSSVEHKKRSNSFAIVTKKRTYYVQAPDQTELQGWTSSINLAKEKYTVKAASAALNSKTQGSNSPIIFGNSPPHSSPLTNTVNLPSNSESESIPNNTVESKNFKLNLKKINIIPSSSSSSPTAVSSTQVGNTILGNPVQDNRSNGNKSNPINIKAKGVNTTLAN